MRSPSTAAAAFCAIAAVALLSACDGERSVRITSSTSDDDKGGVLKVVEALQCPDTLGSLTRKGSAMADGSVCIYTGRRGAEVSLHLIAVTDDQPVDQILARFESQLSSAMPRTTARMAEAQADAARADAEARRADADVARAEADAARAAAASGETVEIRGPGMQIQTEGDRASVHMPGIHIDANGDNANVRIGGLNIRANEGSAGGGGQATINGTLNQESVSIQSNDGSTEVRTRAPGQATRRTYVLSDSNPVDQGWRMVGYEARGPSGGPIVVATVRSKDDRGDDVFDDAKALVRLNVGR